MLRKSILASAAALMVAGCGENESSARGGDCLIFANGNKLCGDDARTYCRSFVGDDASLRDVSACRRIGVKIAKTREERRQEREDAAQDEQSRQAAQRVPIEQAVREALGGEAALLRGAVVVGDEVNIVLSGEPKRTSARSICEAVVEARPDVGGVDVEGAAFDVEDGRCEELYTP